MALAPWPSPSTPESGAARVSRMGIPGRHRAPHVWASSSAASDCAASACASSRSRRHGPGDQGRARRHLRQPNPDRPTRIRRTVLAHAILSYLFGVVIVAGSVSLISGLIR
jgi:hypothetical protein